MSTKKRKQDYEKAVKYFLSKPKEAKQFGKYFVYPNAIIHRTFSPYASNYLINQAIETANGQAESLRLNETVIAAKVNNILIGNSSMLENVDAKYSFGHFNKNRQETRVQTLLSKKILMLPFGAFKEAGLSLTELEVIERGKSELITRKEKHYKYKKDKAIPYYKTWQDRFTGACLFKVKDAHYLLDVDRQEVKHGLFNAFIATLPKAVKSIKEAYQSLKPSEVITAEKQGLKVKRQGEFFFIPTTIKPNDNDEIFGNTLKPSKRLNSLFDVKFLRLKSSDNGNSHLASIGFIRGKKAYVKGSIQHTGREHKDLYLGEQWHVAIPNTAVKNVTLKGDID